MRAVIYLRKSTDDARHQKASIDDQRKWAEEYVKNCKTDLRIVRVFEERKTAKAPWRPLFNEMMGMFYANEADAVITWDIDRLSRNEVDEGTLKWAIRQGKIKQVHTHNSIYTEHELLTMGIFLSLGAEEIAKMRQRVMRRMQSMIQEWKVPYLAPYGYKNKDWGAIIDPVESKVLKTIFKLRTEGYSFIQISDELNARSIPARWRTRWDAKKWFPSSIEQIIKNEFYKGIVRFAGQIGEGIHERIISRDIFDAANSEHRTNIWYKKHNFPLKGIIKNMDGRPLFASLVKRKYVYYHTKGWKFKISQTELYNLLNPITEKWVFPESAQKDIQSAVKSVIEAEHSAAIEEAKIYREKKEGNELKLSRLLRLYTINGISDEEYTEQRSLLIEEKRKLDDNVSTFIALEASLIEKSDKIFELLRNLSKSYKTGDDILRGCILKEALFELRIDKEKRLQIQQKETFEDLFLLSDSKWLPE